MRRNKIGSDGCLREIVWAPPRIPGQEGLGGWGWTAPAHSAVPEGPEWASGMKATAEAELGLDSTLLKLGLRLVL